MHLPPETLREAVELSVRYLPGRFLPDKAIDLVDEACAAARIRAEREGKADPTLTREDIARVVAQASGVPVERVGRRRSGNGWTSWNPASTPRSWASRRQWRRWPGPSGAAAPGWGAGPPHGGHALSGAHRRGQTALAKALAASWFGSEKALLKFDMSEYQEQHTTARLLGAPPGYLGHDEGGQLTEAVRRRPYSVVLFDEIEKAHPDIQNILLQILEDGQLTDAMGRKADFRNTIVLLTSNLGARFLAGQSAPLGFAAGSEAVFEKQSAQAIEEAKKWFRPELVGRLDELIVFRPLAEDSLCAIADEAAGPAGSFIIFYYRRARTMKIIPLADRVVIKAVEVEETTKGGLILTGSAKEKPQVAEVVAVGPGGNVDGKEVEMIVKVGDKVLTSKYSGTEVKVDGEECTIVRQGDILAIVE